MNRDEIIRVAREAEIVDSHGYIIANELAHLERFAALVAAAEREACAKAAQDFLTSGRSPLGRSVADAIRERLLNAKARAVGDRAYDRYEGETK